MENTASKLPTLRRRDFLKWSVLGVAGYALVKGGTQAFTFEPASGSWRNLSATQARIFAAAALAIAGPTARSLFAEKAWDPVYDFDLLLDRVPAEQRTLMLTGLSLFEHWTLLGGFSTLPLARQIAHLDAWKNSRIALRRSVWGLLHAATAVSFGARSGWALMEYPGPCIASEQHDGRAPGQSAVFAWDESVP
jgi:hypothetical protein